MKARGTAIASHEAIVSTGIVSQLDQSTIEMQLMRWTRLYAKITRKNCSRLTIDSPNIADFRNYTWTTWLLFNCLMALAPFFSCRIKVTSLNTCVRNYIYQHSCIVKLRPGDLVSVQRDVHCTLQCLVQPKKCIQCSVRPLLCWTSLQFWAIAAIFTDLPRY